MSNTNSLSVSEYNERLVQRFFKNNHLPFDRKEADENVIFSTEISVEIEKNVSVNTFLLMTINKEDGELELSLLLQSNVPQDSTFKTIYAMNELNCAYDMVCFSFDTFFRTAFMSTSLCNCFEKLCMEKIESYTARLLHIFVEIKILCEGVTAGDIDPTLISRYLTLLDN